MTSDYKKYSLDKLEEWMHDAMSVSEATPQEIYDVIKGVVEENYYTYKHQTSQAYELLALLNGNGQSYKDRQYEDVLRKMGSDYYEYTSDELEKQREIDKKLFGCDKDYPSLQCNDSFNSFWEENYYPEEVKDDCMPPWGHSDMEYLSCNKDDSSPECKGAWSDFWEENYYPKEHKKDKVVKWQLPVEETKIDETDETEYFITFPDDLLEAANLKEGDAVEWIDNGDGSYILKKCETKGLPSHQELMDNGYKTYEEAVKDGWCMTGDGFWIKE